MYINEETIFLVATLLIAIMYRYSQAVDSLTHDIFRVITLIWSQNILNLSTNHNLVFEIGKRLDVEILLNFVVSTCILIGSSAFFSILSVQSWAKQVITLILYMYVEAIENIVSLLHLQNMILPLCILIYFLIFHFQKTISKWVVTANIIQAMQMTSINIILASVLMNNVQSLYIQTGFLLLILSIVDTLSELMPILKDSKDYALWKVSSHLAQMYAETELPVAVSAVLLVLLFFMNMQHINNTQTVLDLSLLTILNHIVDRMTEDAFSLVAVQKSIDAFCYLTIFSSIMQVLGSH